MTIRITCINCENSGAILDYNTVRNPDDAYPDVEFRDIVYYCPNCKYTFSIVGSKRITNI